MQTLNSTRSQNNLRSRNRTPYLQRYGKNLNEFVSQSNLIKLIGRDKELERVTTILCKGKKRNPLLTGEPGVGKTAIVEGLAKLIVSGNVPNELKQKTIWEIKIIDLTAGSSARGEFEEKLSNILNEVSNDENIILFIDEIHTLMTGIGNNAADSMKPFLARDNFQCIGATTNNEFQRIIENDKALTRRFQQVIIKAPDTKETKIILSGIKKTYESKHNIFIPDELISKIVLDTDKYIKERNFPDKAIDLLDEACAYSKLRNSSADKNKLINELKSKKERSISENKFEIAAEYHRQLKILDDQSNQIRILNSDSINHILAQWTNFPIDEFGKSFSNKISDFKKLLNENLIGQDNAKESVLKSLKRLDSIGHNENKPLYTSLCFGPTGVGKSEFAKIIAQGLFGSRKNIFRVDMSEYQESHSVARLIGSPPGYVGYDEGGQLVSWVRNNPYGVILFDEIEKAHSKILDLFLQIFEEGELTDGKGRKCDFRNSIIILTSNILIEDNKSSIGFEPSEIKIEVDYRKKIAKYIRPEIINRIDDIIKFESLTSNEMKQIIRLSLNSFIEKIRSEKEIVINYNQEVLEFLYNRKLLTHFGAREIKRLIKDEIIDQVADCIYNSKEKIVKISIEVDNSKLNFVSEKI